MLGQYGFAGIKLERLSFIALIQHAQFHPTTCPVLNSWERAKELEVPFMPQRFSTSKAKKATNVR